ncbi:hypothetical protein GCM10027049_03770 [Mucilaginibacter puniceus]
MVVLKEYNDELTGWVISFGLCALLFNPIIPVHLQDKAVWNVIDFCVAVLFFAKALSTKPV